MKKTVSILTPAYNMELLIPRLLNSVLSQTYPYISMVVINDGSNDNTASVVSSYISKFEKRGYSLKLVNQENLGQSFATNNGLKLIDGDFFVWPDADDWYASKDSIAKLVACLESSDEDVGVVKCAYNRIEERTFSIIKTDYPTPQNESPEYLFEDAVFDKPGFWYEPGGWMVKTKFLDELIPGRNIYTTKFGGQNVQILLPYLFHKKCINIQEPLFNYLVRSQSHSRGMLTDFEKKSKQITEITNTFLNVFDSLQKHSNFDMSRYKLYKETLSYMRFFRLCFRYKKRKLLQKYYLMWKQNESVIKVDKGAMFLYMLSHVPPLFWILPFNIFFANKEKIKKLLKMKN